MIVGSWTLSWCIFFCNIYSRHKKSLNKSCLTIPSVRFLQLGSYNIVSYVHLKVWVVYPKHNVSDWVFGKENSRTYVVHLLVPLPPLSPFLHSASSVSVCPCIHLLVFFSLSVSLCTFVFTVVLTHDCLQIITIKTWSYLVYFRILTLV